MSQPHYSPFRSSIGSSLRSPFRLNGGVSLRAGSRPLRALICATVISAAAVSGCAKSSSGDASKDKGTDAVASLGTTPKDSKSDGGSEAGGKSDAGDTTASGATLSQEDAAALYNACMTDAGFGTVLVLEDSSGAAIDAPVSSPTDDSATAPFDQDAFNEADAECSKHLEGAFPTMEDFSPEQQAAIEDAMATYKKCMGDKGYKISMSMSGSGAGMPDDMNMTEANELNDKIAADPEAYDAADQECSAAFTDNDTLNDLMSSDGASG